MTLAVCRDDYQSTLVPDARSEWPTAGGLIKICGLRRPEDVRAATEGGADLLGFIFAPAKRQVTAESARRGLELARSLNGTRAGPLAVGVFVDASADDMNATADAAGLDFLQLHGDEPPDLLGRLTRPVIKALRPPPGTRTKDLFDLISRYKEASNAPVAFVVDGYSPTAHGGAGVRADWALVRELTVQHRIILAGGLDPENVSEAIRTCAPFAVDVSSGVERTGSKDAERIGAFVRSARSAFVACQASGVDGAAGIAPTPERQSTA